MEDLKPGRELDALIAEKVMGDKWCQLMPEGYADKITGPRKCKCGAIGFPYEHHRPCSTDIAAAWMVVEKLRNSGKWCCLKLSSDYHYCWDVILTLSELSGLNKEHKPTIVVSRESLPLAICLAALKSVEEI